MGFNSGLKGFKKKCRFYRHDDIRSEQILENIPFVNRTIKLWNQLFAELLATFPCKLHSFRKRVKEVSICKWNLIG
jgi:hypothetical protein